MHLEQRDGLNLNPLQVIQNSICERENLTTVYRSPFEIFNAVPEKFSDYRKHMSYTGSTSNLITELGDALIATNDFQPHLPLHPPRLIRALVNWKIDHPEEATEDYIQQAIQIALAVYQKNPEALSLLDDLDDQIQAQKPSILNAKVTEDLDLLGWEATKPQLSYATARDLATNLAGEDILFIALAHGGVPAGLDVFLRYSDITNNKNSVFYPTRLSMYDMQDTQPQVSNRERELLRKMKRNREVVIFDEDQSSGETMHTAASYFCGLFNTYSINVRANIVKSNNNYF